MHRLEYDENGAIILSRNFLNELVDVLSRLPDFEEELSLVSCYYKDAVEYSEDKVIVDEFLRDAVKESLENLCEEEFEEYTGLKEAYAEANLMRDLIIDKG
jgi:hypothetical protein